MEKFTASNGVEVQREDQGALTISPRHGFMRLADDEVQALREYFQHERDQELGRWRERPGCTTVVYPNGVDDLGNRCVIVLYEPTAGATVVYENKTPGNLYGDAAKNYFAAHPEPKPWHDAKPGEVWVLSVDGSEDMVMTVHESKYGGFRFRLNDREGTIYALDTPVIRAGRRIWPEVSDE